MEAVPGDFTLTGVPGVPGVTGGTEDDRWKAAALGETQGSNTAAPGLSTSGLDATSEPQTRSEFDASGPQDDSTMSTLAVTLAPNFSRTASGASVRLSDSGVTGITGVTGVTGVTDIADVARVFQRVSSVFSRQSSSGARAEVRRRKEKEA